MKKHISISAVVLMLSLTFTSCKKHKQGTVNYQTIEINLDANRTYQYNFGDGKKDLLITKQSSSYVVSEIDRLNETNLFNYSPKLNTASDEVEVTLFEEEEHHGHGGQGHHDGNGNCQNHPENNNSEHHDADDDRTIYIFKFNVVHTSTSSSTKSAASEM